MEYSYSKLFLAIRVCGPAEAASRDAVTPIAIPIRSYVFGSEPLPCRLRSATCYPNHYSSTIYAVWIGSHVKANQWNGIGSLPSQK